MTDTQEGILGGVLIVMWLLACYAAHEVFEISSQLSSVEKKIEAMQIDCKGN